MASEGKMDLVGQCRDFFFLIIVYWKKEANLGIEQYVCIHRIMQKRIEFKDIKEICAEKVSCCYIFFFLTSYFYLGFESLENH